MATAVLAAAATALGGVAQASPSNVSPQWSGYAVTAPKVSFSSITGTWTEPVVHCASGAAPALSTVWVGLGGYGSGSQPVEQVGTDANCDAKGKATYFAWFELVPDIAHTIGGRVVAGDTVTGSVKRLRGNLVELRLENRTRHWTFVRRLSAGAADTSSAEWIAEAPYACVRFSCHQAPLANFGSIRFQNVAAVGNGLRGSLSNARWTTIPISLAPCANDASSRAGARPGTASSDGMTFGIVWIPEAARASTCKNHASAPQVGGLPDYTEG